MRLLAQQAVKKLEELKFKRSTSSSRNNKEDLNDSTKWGLGDAVQFGTVLRQYSKDLKELKEMRDVQKSALKALQSETLKAATRKEEIERFNKAKSDEEFKKMLKSRSLGPENFEAQTQLRRNIWASIITYFCSFRYLP